MNERDNILIEEGINSLRNGLRQELEVIKKLGERFNPLSIASDQILGQYKELYKTKLNKIKKLNINVSDITKQYESVIKSYNLQN
jgi:hypothetical protein